MSGVTATLEKQLLTPEQAAEVLSIGRTKIYEIINASELGGQGALGGTRTPNLLIRSQMLFPIELRALAPPGGGAREPLSLAARAGPANGDSS